MTSQYSKTWHLRALILNTPIGKQKKKISGAALVRSAYILQEITGNANIEISLREWTPPEANLLGLLAELSATAGLNLLLLLLLQEDQSVDLVLDGVLRGNGLLDLLTANQGSHDGGTDNEGQDETVHAVPVGSTAGGGSAGIVVVQEGESEELTDQSVLDGEEKSRPGDSGGDHTSGVAAVTDFAAVASPLKTPVDGTEEREDLDRNRRLEKEKKKTCGLAGILTTAP